MLSDPSILRRWPMLGALSLAFALAACGGGENDGRAGARGGPVQVGYVEVKPQRVPLTVELNGRVTPYQMSEVRPQVAGVLERRLFTEGSIVREGQPLYRIDPSLYQAAVNEAEANLQSARANAEATKARADRFRPLAEMEAVARQDYVDAAAQARQAAAGVAQSRAQLQTARTNLRFATVPAPITGRIGRSLVTEGALVTANQTNPLAVIQRLDPIFVDIQQSSAELLTLRRALARGGAAPTTAVARLKLEDGSEYGRTGTVEFSEVMVDPDTGTVTLRARFPNPDGVLLPGMFVRASFAQAVDSTAFLIPQPAVTRNPRGEASLFVVGAGNKAERRSVVAERALGTDWVVTSGLKAGDKVIVQFAGSNPLTPGAPLKPVPAGAPQRIAPPQQGAAKRDEAKGGGDQAKGG